MAAERRTLGLAAALIVAIGALVVVRSMDDPPANPPRRNAPPGRPGRTAAQAATDPAPSVKLDQLARNRDEPADSARNPFRFRPKPPPSPPPAAAVTPTPAGKPGSIGGPVAPAPPPGPPPITLKFIGIVEKADGTRIAVLSDGKRPFYGVDGQEIDGQYKILKIGLESLEIAYIDGRGRQTLRLNGQ
jgi:hypothetical protein